MDIYTAVSTYRNVKENANQNSAHVAQWNGMIDLIDRMKAHLSANDFGALHLDIQDASNRLSWEDNIRCVKSAVESLYQKHWLKVNHSLLSVFGVSELLGVDCNIFHHLSSLKQPRSVEQASEELFRALIQIAHFQLREGGSTLFFNIERISSTRSAIIISDLVKARYRETIFVLQEIDQMLYESVKEWIDVSRLWRTGNGYRFLKVRNIGTHIHINEYKEIRSCLSSELGCDPDEISEECQSMIRNGDSSYLRLSETLDEFMTGLVASLGIRGKFDQYYRIWINNEGLDEF